MNGLKEQTAASYSGIEYLGYCKLKGFIYSVQRTERSYSIVALRNGAKTVLIAFDVSKDNECWQRDRLKGGELE